MARFFVILKYLGCVTEKAGQAIRSIFIFLKKENKDVLSTKLSKRDFFCIHILFCNNKKYTMISQL
jgi:hypothetical protein